MRLLAIFTLLTMQAGPQPLSAQSPSLRWRIADSLEKVRPHDRFPNVAAKRVMLSAARNEFETFQIVLCSDERDLTDVDVEVSELRAGQGAAISPGNITIYLERFLNITQPSVLGGATGLWPDPLIPRVDRYAHEKRNAFPFVLRRGENQPVWIDVFVPPGTQAGKYTGSAHISRGGRVALSIPINLTVRAFELPSTSTLRSSFGLNGTALLKQHRGQYTSDDDLYALTRVYAQAALQHRISIHGGSMVPPAFRMESGRAVMDWRRYDAEVGPFLNGTAIPEGEPLHGARSTSVELRTPSRLAQEDERAAYWQASIKHFQEMGWYDRLFLYLWDEPKQAEYAKVLERGQAAQHAFAGLRSLLTTPFTSQLKDVVRIWTPLVNCLERKPGFGDFCVEAPPLEAYSRELQQGKSLWFYQSCASHGCNIPGGEYFAGWPSYMIDASAAANRVMPWIAAKYGIEGELYFSMNEAFGPGKDPWSDVRLFGGNGDGTLFYPGLASRIGGKTDVPIESIRLKLIREGMEDYEYLSLFAKLGDPQAGKRYAQRMVTKPYLWESRPAIFLGLRQEMGEALDRLVKSGSASRGDDN